MIAESLNSFAFFARGIDGFYLPREAPGYALVRSGMPEVEWARSFMPADRVVEFQSPKLQPEVYPATESLLLNSDIARLLRRRQIGDLLLSSSCSAAMHEWSQQNKIRFLAADFEHQRRLENKIWFDRFLRRVGIRCPAGGTMIVGRKPPLLPRGRLVLQVPDSQGGEGTYFVDGAEELATVAQAASLQPGQRCLVRQFIEGVTYGITVFVAPGTIALSAIRSQCYYPRGEKESRQRFAGVQWIPSDRISQRLQKEIDRVLLQLGNELYRLRYFGVANIDFLVDRHEKVWIIECNPRMSAATPQLLADPQLSGGMPCGELFLQGFCGPRRYTAKPRRQGLPKTTFAGASLDLLPDVTDSNVEVNRDITNGTYRCERNGFRFIGSEIHGSCQDTEMRLFSFAAKGQQADGETTLGSILSPSPLYDDVGKFNALAERAINNFRYT